MINKLHLEITGTGAPLVMLHGWGWDSGIWQPLVPILKKKYQLFLVDLPGFGKSPVLTTDYKFETIAPLIFALVPTKATWLGWSLGGMLAWWITIHYPEKVSRLITVASSPKFVCDKNWPGVENKVLENFSTLLVSDYQKTLQDFLELQLRGSPKRQELFDKLKNQLLEKKQIALPALLGGLELLRETDLRQDLHKIKIPSLHIFGGHDTLVPAKIADLLPQGRCEIIKRAGHMPFLSQQEEFINLITEAKNNS